MKLGRMEMGEATQRAQLAIWALGANAVMSAVQIWAYQYQSEILVDAANGQLTPERAQASVESIQSIGYFHVALCLFTAVVFLRWLHRAYENARHLGRRSTLMRSSSEAVWAFLIPIINLRRPIQVLDALRNASDPSDLPPADERAPDPIATYRQPAESRRQPRPRAKGFFPVTAWWGLWIGAGVLSRLGASGVSSALRSHGARLFVTLDQDNTMAVIAELLALLSAVFGIFVVREIVECQKERYARRAARRQR